MKTLLIIYLIIAALCFLAMFAFVLCAWRVDDAEEMYLYDEMPNEREGRAGAILIFILVGTLAAILWPALPLILIGVLIEEKIEAKCKFKGGAPIEEPEEKEEEK